MFRISGVKPRYFEFEAPDNGRVLHIEPPKLKTMNQLNNLAKAKQSGISETANVIAKIISKNKENRRIDANTVMEWMDGDQLTAFLKAFVGWMKDEKESDPN